MTSQKQEALPRGAASSEGNQQMHFESKVAHDLPYYFKTAVSNKRVLTAPSRSDHSELPIIHSETISSTIEKEIKSRLTELQGWISADLTAKDNAIAALSEVVTGLLVRCEVIQATMASNKQQLLDDKRRRKSA